jgi:hypothetical protein
MWKLALMIPLLPWVVKLIPFPSLRRRMINLTPLPALRRIRDIVDFMDAAAAQVVRDRRTAIESGDLDTDAKYVMSLLSKYAVLNISRCM